SNLGLIDLNNGDYAEAWIKFELALTIYKNLNNIEGMAESLYKQGLTYYEQKSYIEALNKHKEAIQILVKNKFQKHPLVKVLKNNIKLIKSRI
ncbi:MAG: tetratricopeptide repeat protein, partial [Promethearchaeota archaeon]